MSTQADQTTENPPNGQSPAGIYPGWWVVFATASGQLIQGGFVFWSMGLYTATFEDVFGAPRAQINLIETCLTVATNLLSPLARGESRLVATVRQVSMRLICARGAPKTSSKVAV